MTVPMAIVDYIPVALFGAAAVLLLRDLYNKMSKGAFALLAAGVMMIFVAGCFKATWKLLYALNVCDFEALNAVFFPMQTTGFVLAAAALIALLTARQGHGAAYAVVEAAAKVVAAGARYERMRYSYQEYFERMTRNPESWGKPLGAPRGKRPRIRVSCVDQLGACRCHHGHKPGDVFDFDRDRGKMCAMACHVGFPYIDILRYGGTVPGNEPGTAKFCCPEVDTLNVWLAEIVDE